MATLSILHLHKNSQEQMDSAKVGDPATILLYSDSHPATVISRTKYTITVQEDSWKVVSGGEHDGSAKYEYERNPNGPTTRFYKSRGGWTCKGYRLLVGVRRRYYDPSF